MIISCGPTHNSGGLATTNSLGAGSTEIFSKTLYPVIEQNCTTCHNGSLSAPAFAADVNTSESVLFNFGLIDIDLPAESKIVQQIANGHNGIDTQVSVDIENAIFDWISELNATN